MKKIFLSAMIVAALVIPAVSFVSCSKSATEEEPKTGIDLLIEEGTLVGTLDHEVTLDASKTYKLTGALIVENGGVLNIPAGTVIKATANATDTEGFGKYILIAQGGKINARGTAASPITFSAEGNVAPGSWGGLILCGKAPLAGGETGTCETNTDYVYGGTATTDNSGVISYIILNYTGARSSANVEHNGLSLYGVGNGTTINNVYVYEGADDGIEFFGGSVNVTNILVVNSDDDMFDFTQGYNGTLENAYGIWETGFTSTEADPRGVEADGNFDGLNQNQAGQSNFIIKNMTIDLRLAAATDGNTSNVTDKMQDVIKMRRNAKCVITNALVKGRGTAIDLIDFSDGKGAGDAASVISLTSELTTTILGKQVNPVDGYPGASIVSGNTGCDKTNLSWTGYNF